MPRVRGLTSELAVADIAAYVAALRAHLRPGPDRHDGLLHGRPARGPYGDGSPR